MVELSEIDNGRTIDLALGQILLVRLPENPTTGYRWEIEGTTEDIVLPQGRTFKTSSTAFGGGGTRVFEFKATSGGTTQLCIRHWQRWEGESSIDRHFKVTIRVPG